MSCRPAITDGGRNALGLPFVGLTRHVPECRFCYERSLDLWQEHSIPACFLKSRVEQLRPLPCLLLELQFWRACGSYIESVPSGSVAGGIHLSVVLRHAGPMLL